MSGYAPSSKDLYNYFRERLVEDGDLLGAFKLGWISESEYLILRRVYWYGNNNAKVQTRRTFNKNTR